MLGVYRYVGIGSQSIWVAVKDSFSSTCQRDYIHPGETFILLEVHDHVSTVITARGVRGLFYADPRNVTWCRLITEGFER